MANEKKKKPQEEEIKEAGQKLHKAEHLAWVHEEFDEGKREKKKAMGFSKKFSKVDTRRSAMFGGKYTHGTAGKPTHGPRGNQG
jgi:hypothetical protein